MSDDLKNDIIRFLSDRAPNTVRDEIIFRRLPKYSREEIQSALDEMLENKEIEPPIPEGQIRSDSATHVKAYQLKSYENILKPREG